MSLCLYILFLLPVAVSAQTSLVQIDGSKHLSYTPDNNGFIIPDFSYAGYHNGGVDLPHIQTVSTIVPISGDNTAHIQAAIDAVGAMPPDANGFRGALLLKKGIYEVTGTLNIPYDGVIIRGEDNTSSGTIIRATGDTPHQRDVIILGNTSQNKWDKNKTNQQNITDDIVPVGAMDFSVADASAYKKGDLIALYHPCTTAWLEAVNYGGVPSSSGEEWSVGQVPIIYHRYITAVSGNRISIDAPVFYSLRKSLAQSYIYKFNASGIKKEIGIENLRVEIISAGGVDENHAWQAVRFRSVENCWAKNVITVGFGQSGFITDCCTRTTIQDCQAIDPVALIEGERRYNFNTYIHSQLILFKNCYARDGRHHYVSNGTSTASGNVFLRCISDATNSVSEGHRQWTQGMLYDNHTEINMKRDFVLGLYNRVDMGTGHGWAAVHSVLWNCSVTSSYGKIGLQQPPTAQNYAIGCQAKMITGKPVNDTDFPIGYVEKQNDPVLEIPSLYEAQLYDRLNNNTAIHQEKTDHLLTITRISKNRISLQFEDSSEEKQITLYLASGQLLHSVKTENNYVEMSLPGIMGVLILLIKWGENKESTYKIFKQY